MGDDNQLLLPSVSDTSECDADTQVAADGTTSPDSGPVQRTKCQTRAAFFIVILTEALERTAFYSLVCNMVLFLNSKPLLWASYHAASALFTLNGVSYITTLFGGWLADAVCGKYVTILGAFVVYVAGCSMWPALYPYPDVTFTSACSPWFENKSHWCAVPSNSSSGVRFGDENCVWAVFLMIIVISFGYGSVRVNIIPFGAHQVEHEGPVATRVYFNWMYWFINVGSLIAFGVMGYVQQEISYFYGYLVPALTLLIAILLFVSGSRFYVKKTEVHGSVLTDIFCICKNAITVSYQRNRRRDIEILTSEIPHSPQVPCCLDYAKRRYGGQYADSAVNNIKALGRVLLVFVAIIPYWTVYYQMQTTFMVQGLHMKLDFNWNNASKTDTNNFKIPASWLTMFDVIFVLLLLPLLDRVIYPRLDRAGYSPSLRLRILIGMLFAVAAMSVAGVVEHYRLWSIWHDPNASQTYPQIIGCTTYYASEMSILWQIPQYALVGISEIFTSTAGLELAFIAAPPSMKGIIMGLYWFCEGIGALLGSATIAIFEGIWFPNFDHGNINCDESPFTNPHTNCHLDYYFYTLAGFQVVGILLFIVVAWVLNMGSSVPLRVQEHGVTVVRPRPLPVSPLPSDIPNTSPIPGHLQRRNTDSRSPVDN